MSTYAALSYCWGTGGKKYETTRQNLSKNKIHLPWEKLPAVSSHDYRVSTRQNAEIMGCSRQSPMLYMCAKPWESHICGSMQFASFRAIEKTGKSKVRKCKKFIRIVSLLWPPKTQQIVLGGSYHRFCSSKEA
jgi:hypothetical protein